MLPLHHEPGSLQIKAQLSHNYLPSPLRLTSALSSEEQTCQQKPAEQKFRQQSGGGGGGGGVIHTKHSFTLILIFVCAQVFVSDLPETHWDDCSIIA